MSLFDLDETLSVGELTRQISNTIKRTYGGEIWIRGQIRNLSRSARGHVYFNLIDPVPAGQAPRASIAVVLFDSNRKIVNRILTRTGNNVRMDDGVEVRIRGTLALYLPRGQMQLTMLSIDPEYTLGRLSVDREQLLANLAADGLLEANRSIALPLVPLRVGLVTALDSAAQADFCTELAGSGYAFETTLVPTRTQGEFAPGEIATAIESADRLNVDVIAVVRGGGARTDLAAFDTEPVARAIAGAGRPVICGIGHEIDTSVADAVAHAAFKTPTATATFLIEQVARFDSGLAERARLVATRAATVPALSRVRLDERAALVGRLAGSTIASARDRSERGATDLERQVHRAVADSNRRLANVHGELRALATAALRGASQRCDREAARLVDLPRRRLRDHRSRLELVEARVDAVDPVRALNRGYSITTTAEGKLVRSPDQVGVGDRLVTRVTAGTITSTVEELE